MNSDTLDTIYVHLQGREWEGVTRQTIKFTIEYLVPDSLR
jgi:hypothetical protein